MLKYFAPFASDNKLLPTEGNLNRLSSVQLLSFADRKQNFDWLFPVSVLFYFLPLLFVPFPFPFAARSTFLAFSVLLALVFILSLFPLAVLSSFQM